jgi:Fe-S-cluster containining protein
VGDENCTVHAHRPLACRAFVAVEDPATCAPSHPRFLAAEHPPVWAHPREHALELALLEIGRTLGLPPVPNLLWALARLHDHPLARAE